MKGRQRDEEMERNQDGRRGMYAACVFSPLDLAPRPLQSLATDRHSECVGMVYWTEGDLQYFAFFAHLSTRFLTSPRAEENKRKLLQGH